MAACSTLIKELGCLQRREPRAGAGGGLADGSGSSEA